MLLTYFDANYLGLQIALSYGRTEKAKVRGGLFTSMTLAGGILFVTSHFDTAGILLNKFIDTNNKMGCAIPIMEDNDILKMKDVK